MPAAERNAASARRITIVQGRSPPGRTGNNSVRDRAPGAGRRGPGTPRCCRCRRAPEWRSRRRAGRAGGRLGLGDPGRLHRLGGLAFVHRPGGVAQPLIEPSISARLSASRCATAWYEPMALPYWRGLSRSRSARRVRAAGRADAARRSRGDHGQRLPAGRVLRGRPAPAANGPGSDAVPRVRSAAGRPGRRAARRAAGRAGPRPRECPGRRPPRRRRRSSRRRRPQRQRQAA